jgi:hypothetical protein
MRINPFWVYIQCPSRDREEAEHLVDELKVIVTKLHIHRHFYTI